MKLKAVEGNYSVYKLPPHSKIPDKALDGSFCSISKTPEELSIVCESKMIFEESEFVEEAGWSLIKVLGPLDFSLTGILASIANPLAEAKISIFAISTYDTDYLMVKSDQLAEATQALKQSSFEIL